MRNRLKWIWYGMRARCRDKNLKSWKYYGGKGVVICEAWADFKIFESWALNNGYSDELTIDRIDGNGNYEPANCRWATRQEQIKNRPPFIHRGRRRLPDDQLKRPRGNKGNLRKKRDLTIDRIIEILRTEMPQSQPEIIY